LGAGINLYVYVENNPANAVDPLGLELRLYSSDAFGMKGLNHAFVWSTETQRGRGTQGSSWISLGDGVGPLDNPYTVIPLPEGMTEEQFMDEFEKAPGWNNWMWIPWVNDCHTDAKRATEFAGGVYPGAPNGRVDIDDEISTTFNRFLNQLKNPIILYRLFRGY
jgi:hypothetical protein